MTWTEWMRLRLVSSVVAIVMGLGTGAPSVFAFADAEQLRPRATNRSRQALGAIEGDPSWSAIDPALPTAQSFSDGAPVDWNVWERDPDHPAQLRQKANPTIVARLNPSTGAYDVLGGGLPAGGAVAEAPSRFGGNLDALVAEANRDAKRFRLSVVSANLGKHIGEPEILPDGAVEAAQAVLDEAEANGLIKDSTVIRNGNDLVVLVSHNRSHESPVAYLLTMRALSAALTAAAPEGSPTRRLASRPYDQLARELEIRPVEFPVTERGAEPMFLVLSQNTAEGAFNEGIWQHAVINPSQGRIENVPGWKFEVSDVHEQRQAASLRRDFRFDTAQGGGQAITAMYGLAAAPEGWAIRRVDPAAYPGRRAPNEPLLVVSGERVGGGKASNTLVLGRGQSGYPAVGEWLQRFAATGYVPGGKENEHLVPVRPMSLSEIARRVPPDQAGMAIVAWQSHANGKLSPLTDSVAHSAYLQVRRKLDEEVYAPFRVFPEMQEFDPFTLVDAAQGRAQRALDAHRERFQPLPEPGSADFAENLITRLIERANKVSGRRTFSSFKIDVGGEPGHQEPPYVYLPVLEATLRELVELGVIQDGKAYAIGDDVQLDIVHTKGANSREIHDAMWYTFVRAGWFAKVLNRKPYGWLQDLPIFKADKTEAQIFEETTKEAHLTDRFVELLKEELFKLKETQQSLGLSRDEQEPVDEDVRQLGDWYARYTRGEIKFTGDMIYKGPPAGNVTGQGIGFAELPITADIDKVGVWGLDKAGPGAFNWPLYWAIYYWKYFEPLAREYASLANYPNVPWFNQAQFERELEAFKGKLKLIEAEIAQKGADGILSEQPDLPIVVEIWDTRNKRVGFFDATTERETIRNLLVAENWFSPRRLWLKVKDGWDPLRPEEYLSETPLADHSTERLGEITGGQYVGKDDPKSVALRKLAERITFFVNFYHWLLLGDERGSHNGDATPGSPLSPIAYRRASPTVRSYPAQGAINYDLSGKNTFAKVEDVFDNPIFEGRRESSVKINEALLAHNEFPPQGVSPGKAKRIPALQPAVYDATPDGAPRARIALWSGQEQVAHGPSDARANALAFLDDALAAIRSGVRRGLTVQRYEEIDSSRAQVRAVGIELIGDGLKEAVDVLIGYHGKVEAAYPLATAVVKTIAPNSPYGVQRAVTINTALEQAKWAAQFRNLDYRLSPAAVRQAADAATTTVVRIHPAAFAQGPDLAIAVERYFGQLAQYAGVSIDQIARDSGVKLVVDARPLVVSSGEEGGVPQVTIALSTENDGDASLVAGWFLPGGEGEALILQKDVIVAARREAKTTYVTFNGAAAPQVAEEFLKVPEIARLAKTEATRLVERIGTATQGAVELKTEWFDVAIDTPSEPPTVALGPTPWLETVSGETTVKVALDPVGEGQVRSAAAGFYAGIEAAATPERRPPEPVVKQLDVDITEAGLIVPKALDIEQTLKQDVQDYQETMQGVRGEA